MAEKEVEETTKQESPTVEEKQPEAESSETAEKPEQTPEEEVEGEEPEQSEEADKNWKAMRERMQELEDENKNLKGKIAPEEPVFSAAKASELTSTWLTQEDNVSLQLDEFKAMQSNPELDPDSGKYDPLFEKIVAGEYRRELDKYVSQMVSGTKRPSLPSAAAITRKLKKTWEDRFGDVSEKAKEAGAEAVKESVKKKEATREAEGGIAPKGSDSTDEELQSKSRRGDYGAVAERIVRSGL